ncbi:MAG: hypothetical protein QM820_57575 [Minicystis sp.]
MKRGFSSVLLTLCASLALASCGGKVVVDPPDGGVDANCTAFCALAKVQCDAGGGNVFPLLLTPDATGCAAIEVVQGAPLTLSIDCAAGELCNGSNCDAATFSAASATLPLGASGVAICKP